MYAIWLTFLLVEYCFSNELNVDQSKQFFFEPQELASMCGFVGWSVGPYVFKKFLKLWKEGLVSTIWQFKSKSNIGGIYKARTSMGLWLIVFIEHTLLWLIMPAQSQVFIQIIL